MDTLTVLGIVVVVLLFLVITRRVKDNKTCQTCGVDMSMKMSSKMNDSKDLPLLYPSYDLPPDVMYMHN